MFQVHSKSDYTYIPVLFLKLFSIIGYYKTLTIVPSAIE